MSHFKDKMHQFRFLLGLRPDPAGGAYSAPERGQTLWLDLRGPTSKGKEGKGRGCCEGNGREERKGPISESQPQRNYFLYALG